MASDSARLIPMVYTTFSLIAGVALPRAGCVGCSE